MKSIRTRFFIYFSLLVVSVIVILILANTFLLKQFYVNRKQDLFEEYYTEINLLETTDYNHQSELFRRIELTTNADILIVDELNQVVYSSRQFDGVSIPPRYVPIDTEVYEFDIINLPNGPGDTFVLRGILDNGYQIELQSPISAIQENVRYVNEFLLYVGMIGIAISLLAAYFIANHITKPIRQINDVTKQMKNLNFETVLSINNKDELGELSTSINKLAETLSKTFDNLNEELRENKSLSQKRRELVNNVSHELKTPLALIQGYSEGLQIHIDSNQTQRDYYTNVIVEEAQNMNRIIENLLEIEDVDTNFKVDITNHVDLVEYIGKHVNKHKMVMKQKNITLKEYYPKELFVDMDLYLTDRVFTNYIVNAINYCEDSGDIIVKITTNETHAQISVYNTFKGFNESELEQLWDSFYKVDSARTRDVGGHGLGLSIVKSIQEQLNQAFGVRHVDQGVEFWFEIALSTINQ